MRVTRVADLGHHGEVVFQSLRQRLPAGATWTPGLDRFGHAQALSGAGDALVAVSLAGSLFFSLSPDASQQQVLLYLVINMAPFALLAPLIGPAIDRFRFGHRWIASALFLVRAACATALAFTLLDLALYFFALALLVGAKASGVTRQALVPGLVEQADQLVSANSRLARLNVIAGGIGGAVGAAVLTATSPAVTLGLASASFVAAAVATTRIPDPSPMLDVAPTVEYEELHAPTIVATAWAFTVVRAAVGFFVFGLAFALRRESEQPWMYAAAVSAYGIGTFGGNTLAPILRRRYREETLSAAALVSLAGVAAFGALGPSRPLVLLVAVVLGGAASIGRQGFDALVQSRAPQASRGRSFARFETRFQLGWVAGAIAATAIGVPIQVSMGVVAVALIPAAGLYLRSIREAKTAHQEDPFDPIEVARRRVDHAAEWGRRGLDRVAVTELASVVELALASGNAVSGELAQRLNGLRINALAGMSPDRGELDWVMAQANELVDHLEAARRVAQDDVVVAVEPPPPPPSSPSSGASPSSSSGASSSPGASSSSDGSVEGGPTCSSTSDESVADHSSPDCSKVTSRRDQSASDR